MILAPVLRYQTKKNKKKTKKNKKQQRKKIRNATFYEINIALDKTKRERLFLNTESVGKISKKYYDY